jgi:hypothetical protein
MSTKVSPSDIACANLHLDAAGKLTKDSVRRLVKNFTDNEPTELAELFPAWAVELLRCLSCIYV